MQESFLTAQVLTAGSGTVKCVAKIQVLMHSNATMLQGTVIKLSCWSIPGEANNHSPTQPCDEFLNLSNIYNELLMWLQ